MSKAASTVEYAFFGALPAGRILNESAQRRMAVLRPVKLILTNYPEGQSETFTVGKTTPNRPEDGTREVRFSREVYIEGRGLFGGPRYPSISASTPTDPSAV